MSWSGYHVVGFAAGKRHEAGRDLRRLSGCRPPSRQAYSCSTLMNAVRRMLVAAVVLTLPVLAQEPRFEVASIKRNNSGGLSMTNASSPGRFVMLNAPTRSLIAVAYPLPSGEVIGGPDWLTSERYDVNATAGHLATRDELTAMLRSLLADRFRLVAHTDKRVRPTYALMLARPDGRLGPDMHRTDVDCEAIRLANEGAVRGTNRPPPPASNGAPVCGMRQDAGGPFRAGGVPMQLLATMLARSAGRPVVNKTGLTGNYEITLNFSAAPTGPDASRDDRPTIFTAVREQLGLRLDAEENPLDVLVIDAIERPSPD